VFPQSVDFFIKNSPQVGYCQKCMKSVLQQLLLIASTSKTDRLASLVPRLTPFFRSSVCVDNNAQMRKSGKKQEHLNVVE